MDRNFLRIMQFLGSLFIILFIYYALLQLFVTTESPCRLGKIRYFTNPFVDFKSEAVPYVNKDKMTRHIDDHIKNITKRLVPSRKKIKGGLYVGISGVAYMFYYLSKNPMLSEKKSMYLEKAAEYLIPALETSAGDKSSFLLGDAGTYALAAILNKEKRIERFNDTLKMYKSLYNTYLNPKFLKNGGDEFFVGRTGYLAGVLWMSRELKSQIFSNEELYKICDVIIANGRDYSMKHKSPCPLMYQYYNTEYLGAAHGVSFILQILMTVPGYLEFNQAAASDIKATTGFVASLQTEEGNWPSCMENIGLSYHKLVHWCHGAPGTIYLMAKAYLVFKDRRFFDACIKAGEVIWRKGLLCKGPGICHGVAGNGYTFLMLYRLTGDQKYLHRAKLFADFMNTDDFLRDARIPDNPESLYEGTAGTVCFLSDLLVPDKAAFPFEDVFFDYATLTC